MQEQQPKAAQIAAALQEAEAGEAVKLSRQQVFGMLCQRHGALVAEYQECKLTARIKKIIGDTGGLTAALEQAALVMQHIKGLRVAASEEGLGAEYDKFIDAFRAQQEAAGKKAGQDGEAEPSPEQQSAANKAGIQAAKKRRTTTKGRKKQ